ncbi:hypothetical protein V8G54_028146 [Vigna mungo]|uniref:EH domain-containing protein 1 n=1 Tax=Vigna mungo TaxID=3915 RepID=A0AAQ3RLF1_VIGMU
MGLEIVPINSTFEDYQTLYEEWFNYVDTDGDGRFTGKEAIKFLAMSNLSRQELKQVWAIADSRREGYLGFKEFVTAMQLVSLGQCGYSITHDLLTSDAMKYVKPPTMEGLDALIAKKKRKHKDKELSGNVYYHAVSPQPSAASNWFSGKSKKEVSVASVTSVIDGLKKLYLQKLKPLEVAYQYNDFVSPFLTNSDFDAKPMILLLGQYSTGKTTFIKHMLRTTYPGNDLFSLSMLLGAHIGPEPTTDRFVVVMSGPDERSIPGNTVAVQADMPFSGLTTFGTSFLSKFECSQMPHPLLDYISFVDSPGVLSGEKQRTQRQYDFTGVTSWFAAKCDLILLLFDPHKLDISDEFKRVISSLKGNDDKIRVVLNKADQVDPQQLMRIYGALMWSLGKALNVPEVMRVYIGSFNERSTQDSTCPLEDEIFQKEQDDLLSDLKDIPKKACDRKIQREFHLPAGDFPDVEQFKETLNCYNIDKFEKLNKKMIQTVEDMLAYDVPKLLSTFRNPYG